MNLNNVGQQKYRSEIDGLRAVAVLAVILFHAEIPYIYGGFVGVDIFFVISGYLIVKIISEGLDAGRFSFIEFYYRRIKRLLPAAFFMLLITVVFGFFILTPDKYVELAKSAIYTSLFAANIWFANNAGYFDQAAEVSPLVHMWSLAVEEQFYLMFPLLLFAAHRFWKLKGIKCLVIACFIVSLTLSISLSTSYPNFSFYLLPTRAWELCLGAMVAIFPILNMQQHRLANILAVLGTILIVISLFFISRNVSYPSYAAVLPTMGTALLIASVRSSKVFSYSFLTSIPMVSIGKFSYSAYLWHWPVVVYYRTYISERSFDWLEMNLLVIISLILGYLSWRFIEEKYRYHKWHYSTVYFAGASSIVVIIILSLSVYVNAGYSNRFTKEAIEISDTKLMWNWKCAEKISPFNESDKDFCVIGAKWESAKNKGIVWGDSHSMHWAPLLHELASSRDIALVIAPLDCPPYLNSRYVSEHYPKFPDFTERCSKKHDMTIGWLNSQKDVTLIIMAAAWSGHLQMLYDNQQDENELIKLTDEDDKPAKARLSEYALQKTLDSIDLSLKRVLLLGDVPRPNRNLNECAFNDMSSLLRAECDQPYTYLDADVVRAWHKDSNVVLQNIAAANQNVFAISAVDAMCDKKQCATYYNGQLIYKDNNHLRRNLSVKTLSEIEDVLHLGHSLDTLTAVNGVGG